MKISALKNLIVLSESQSINEAASKLFIAQPSLTKSIHLLENELGFAVFHRSSTGIELTEGGKIVVEDARKIIEMYNNWLKIPSRNALKSLKIYCSVSFSDFLIPDAIVNVKAKYPDLRVSYHTVGNPEYYISPDISEPVLVMTVCDDKMIRTLEKVQRNPPLRLIDGRYECLMNSQSPLKGKKQVTVEDLKDMFLILPTTYTELCNKSTFLESIMDNIIRAASSHVLEVDSLWNVIDTVRKHTNSYAVSFYPALCRYQGIEEGQLFCVPFAHQKNHSTLCLFYSERALRNYEEVHYFVQNLLDIGTEFVKEHQITG